MWCTCCLSLKGPDLQESLRLGWYVRLHLGWFFVIKADVTMCLITIKFDEAVGNTTVGSIVRCENAVLVTPLNIKKTSLLKYSGHVLPHQPKFPMAELPVMERAD